MYEQLLIQASQSGASGGIMSGQGVVELMKALEAGNHVSPEGLTGGGALRVQSLDRTMQATIVENEHFALFNRMPKPNIGSVIDEWTEQKGVGGFLGGSTNTEAGNVRGAQGDYARRVGEVKFLMTRREVTFVASIQQGIASAEGVEQTGGAKQLLSDAEYLAFEGNSAVVPTEFDGIFAQIKQGVASGLVDAENIVDVDGGTISDFSPLAKAAAQVTARRNFGTPTDLFMSVFTQADLDANLQPAYRVGLTDVREIIELGAPVSANRTTAGRIPTTPDVFIRDERDMRPFQVEYPAIAANNAGMTPSLGTVAHAADVESRFKASRAGTYFYAVASASAEGQSPVVISSAVAIAAGESATLTITRSASQKETGYVIYRSRQDGTNAVTDFREVCRIPVSGANTTVFKDQNRMLPGSTKATMLNMKAGDTAIQWRQMLPMMKFPLAAVSAPTVPWLQLLFGYLRLSKLRHHVIIVNIVPTNAEWRPHTGE
jgi:hypothetical protein